MTELKPCPFCGSAARRYAANVIICSNIVNCGAEIHSGDSGRRTEEFTVKAWNTRAMTAQPAPAGEPSEAEVRALTKELQRSICLNITTAGARIIIDAVRRKVRP